MRKYITLLFVLFFCSQLQAQYIESFTDGDFTSNPTWSGDAALFKVNTSFQLQLNGSADAIAALSVPIVVSPEMEWSCWVKLAFSPSDNNMARIYISSDQQDLKGSLNGYYIKLGEALSNDAIELWRQSGNIHTLICRGTDAFISAAFAIKIKVVRIAGGNWKVYADQQGGNNYQLQASGTDNTFSTGSYTGVYCKYTSSNSTKFYFDDFYAGPLIIDNVPPQALSVSVATTNLLTVRFSEPVSNETAVATLNYTITPGTFHPISATVDNTNASIINLLFDREFTSDVIYSLNLENIKDLAGNTIVPVQLPFSWHKVKAFDVLINEIMADPSPPVGLPNFEYIELFNRSAFPIDLQHFSIVIGGTVKPLPAFTLPAGGYVILCDDAARPLLETYGPVIDFTSFAVTNADGTITLQNPEGQVIHSVTYSDTWYKSSYKKDGGWSLELIDPLNPCGEDGNWIASIDNSGGTPGKINSVHASNPDHTAPAISRVGISDPSHLIVWFSETCDSATILKTDSYSIDNEIGNPASVLAIRPEFKTALLTLAKPLVPGILYNLTCSAVITDCAGNAFATGSSAKFAIPSQASEQDIIINELLFDPTVAGVDFVEVFNRSSKVIDLKDLVLVNYDTINKVITKYCEISPQSLLLLPGDYFVLTTDSAAVKKCYKTEHPLAFTNMGTFPTMNNDAGLVALTQKGGTVIDLVAYNANQQFPLLTSVDGV